MDTLELPHTASESRASTPRRTGARRARRTRPWHRPPFCLRFVVGLVGAAVLAAIVALMLSDRAPGVLDSLFGDAAQRLSERIDASERLSATQQLPESDFLVHAGLWATAAVLVGWALWTWWGLLVGAVVLFATSVFVEAGQGRWSDTRAVEADDVVANALGIGVGVSIATACYIVWSLAGMTVDRLRSV